MGGGWKPRVEGGGGSSEGRVSEEREREVLCMRWRDGEVKDERILSGVGINIVVRSLVGSDKLGIVYLAWCEVCLLSRP